MIPLYHDFTGETVLVLGGGRVGARKARRFGREARVVVVAPSFVDADFGDADRVREAPDPGAVADWLDRTDPALVVAATDDGAVNAAAERAARERGVLVNRADVSVASDEGPDEEEDVADGDEPAGARRVVVPATVEDGPVSVAVSTGGHSPALSKYLRELFEEELAGAGGMARLTAALRADLRERGVDPAVRRDAVRRVVRSSSVWKALRTGESNPRREAERIVMQETGTTREDDR